MEKEEAIIAYIKAHPSSSSKEINEGLNGSINYGDITFLIAHHYCPMSFRTVDSVDYKKAMLLFYEQNNLSAFKQIFINQFKFAVETYF